MTVRRLPPEVVDLIKAGEVLERPASAVKELVENALDAGARTVEVSIAGGGIDEIVVADDGAGIAAEDLPLVVEPHTTSKVAARGDLEAIATYGFRGEALAALAVAADVEIASRTASADGARLFREDGAGGARWVVAPTAAAPGTRVVARRLFARVLVRRKFLRSERAEAAAVAAVVERYALARPDVRFVLRRDGAEALRTAGDGDLGRVVAAVWGEEAARGLHEVEGTGPAAAVRGLVGPPGAARPSRSHQAFAVNGRPVRDAVVASGLAAAFEGLLARGLHPVAVLAVEVPPDRVDANVHPAKAEVRFRDAQAVRDLVRRAVRARLRADRPVERWEFPVRATGDFAPLAAPIPIVRETRPAPVEEVSGLPERRRLAVLGTLGARYVVAAEDESLVLVDAHAAHERVLFDRLAREIASGRPAVQPLLVPARLEATADEDGLLEAHRPSLAEAGIEVEPFGPRAWAVAAVPAVLADADPVALVREVVAALAERGRAEPRALSDLIARTACRSAVRTGRALDPVEAASLLASLERADDPTRCPHGRPTIVRLPLPEIDRRFGRT